nr:intermembrane lipid transfer protein VPS13C-like [Anolis sagrei ordinatus]
MQAGPRAGPPQMILMDSLLQNEVQALQVGKHFQLRTEVCRRGCKMFVFLLQNSHIKKLAGESFCFHCTAPGGRKANVVVTNRRVMLIKEVEILGHITTDWDYSYEDFTRPPAVTNNVLHVYVKRVCQAIDEAQASRHQQKLVKQASLRLSRS